MSDPRKVMVFEDKARLVAFVVKRWRDIYNVTMREKGYMAVALSGGRTPVDLYRALALEGDRLPWRRIHIFLVDERFVPYSDKESNYGMMREVLFEKVHIPEGNIHPIETHLPGPDEAASRYEEEMIRFFRLKPRQIPQFDLVLLGLGEDGHTASLFPGSPVLHDTNHLARAVARDKELFHRITITIPVINHSEHTMFLV